MILPSGHEVRFETIGRAAMPLVGAFVGRQKVGELVADREIRDSGRLMAFSVKESVVLKPSLLGSILGKKPVEIALRRHGIGSMLLELFMAQCREDKTRQVTAGILPQQLQEIPDLPGWFERRGFRIEEPDETCPANSVKMAIWRNPERLFV